MILSAAIHRRLLPPCCAIFFFAVTAVAPAAPPSTEILPPGYRPVPPGVHALVGANVVVKPGKALTNATVIIRDGLIESVGADAKVPADARVWEMKGLTVYAGFIDPYLTLGAKTPEKPATPADEESGSDFTAAGSIRFFGLNPQTRETPGPGYEVSQVTPERRVAQAFAPDSKALEKLREIGFTAGNVVPEKGVIRGTSAFALLGDMEPNRAVIKPDVFQHISLATERRGPGGGYPGSLMGIIAVVRQSFFDAQHYALVQADYSKHPAGHPRPAYNLGLEALEPAVEHKMHVVIEPHDALMVDRATRLASELKLDYYLLSSGQEWRRPDLAKAANVPFIVPLDFPTLPKMPTDDDWQQISLDQLRAWDWASENPAVLHQQGLEIALTTFSLGNKADFRKNLKLAIERGLPETNALAALTTIPAKLCGVDKQLGTIEPGKIANLTVVDGKGYFDTDSKINSVWIDGRYYRIATDDKDKDAEKKPKDESTAKSDDKKEPKDDQAAADKKKQDKEKKVAKQKELQKRVAHPPMEGRGVLTNPPAVLIRNATIWTSGPKGILEHAMLLASGGKVSAIGGEGDTSVPRNTLEIDGTGLFVTPGLIDCHSHSMILGGVNEGTLPSSAMVRIGDVVNSETANIYEQLAGGLTAANLLHGSANPIGGQNCVIKLRDGETPEGLKLAGAPEGIKFALGENVKQSNWGDRNATRFPQTRMGVRTFYDNRFTAAKQYLKEWAEYKKSGGLPPRRDLELEALGEIIEGKRLIHCHSYRQDEILSLIRLMDDFGVKIASFQHVLEGYKVADEIAKHGAGGSTFSDWWAYKFEVYDAIPYNGTLMHDRGVVVSFNSDSSDLARRLYLEAAKAVKFGGLAEPEALKFVTLNPAKQLHIDSHVGSLEVGKDADFAIWSKSPLDSGTVCLQTWIDGKKYFDIKQAPDRAAALAKERAALLEKAKKLAEPGKPDAGGSGDSASFFSQSLEHQYDGVTRHCEDED
jgi:imidazolonepropionase-like amidohydrolase